MADTYEKDLGQKSSLTTSDFIRVVGSDNVSYKQLVSDVADRILTSGKSASTTGNISDLDAITPFTTGYATFAADVSPTGVQSAYWYSMIGWGTGARAEITCVDVRGTVYTRVKDYSGWKAWVKQPTRAEIDALNSNLTVKDIKSKLSSSVATIQAAYSQRIGNVVIVQLRFTLTSAVAPHTDVISGFDRSNSNYSGINSFSLYDNTAEEFFGAQVTHLDGSTTESLRTLSSLASGHNIRGTFMYIAA